MADPKRKLEIERCIRHIEETDPIRRKFWHMDDKVANLIEGIQQGDDSVVVGKTVVNMEGPYPLKIGMKTGLIHTCSDIVVMGAKPLYALDAMQVESVEQSIEVAEAIKKQSDGLGVPIIGGNTQMEQGLIPCVSFCIIGEMIKNPVPDSGAKAGDRILMLGEVVEGETGERVRRVKIKFATFLELIKKADVHAAKDASRGGWFGNLVEMMLKAKRGFKITSVPYPSFGRYLGTYLVSVSKKDEEKVLSIASRHNCSVVPIGEVTKGLSVSLGGEELISAKRMERLIRENPFKKPNLW
jgi:selenophosphate synthetase-related protein